MIAFCKDFVYGIEQILAYYKGYILTDLASNDCFVKLNYFNIQ